MKYLAGLDLGTTGAKALIIDVEGNEVGQGYYEYACDYPKPMWVEQDVDMIVGRSMDAVRDAIQQAEIDPADVLALAASSQRCCTILLDAHNNLIRPMISWQDNRCVDEIELIRQEISDKEFHQITGHPQSTTWVGGKLLWLRRNEPETYRQIGKIVQLQGYVLKQWGTDDYIDDYSDASFYGFWNPHQMDWHDELCRIVGVNKNWLPQVGASGTVVGKVGIAAAARSGLKEGTPICIGAGDQNSAAVGAGVVCPGTGNVSLGTGGAAVAYSDRIFRDKDAKVMVTHHPVPGKWMIEGYQSGAASVYRWFRDEIACLESAFARHSNRDVYQLLDDMIVQVPPGAKGLVLLPYFAGAAMPRWNPNARGTLIGLTFAHDRQCLTRAFMEGITLDVRDMLESIRSSDVELNDIRILGGPTKSRIWNQIQADIYQCPVRTLRVTDAAVVGASIFAGLGAGVFPDIVNGCEKMVKLGETYQPIEANMRVYNESYKIFCQAYQALNVGNVFQAVAENQTSHS